MWYDIKNSGGAFVKDTTKIVKELDLCEDFKTFYDENRDYMIEKSLAELLNSLIEEKKLKKSQIVKTSEISEVYAYQIFSGLRIPERKKLLCVAIAMSLNLDEVQTLLKCAGYSPLYVKLPFDSVVMYGICKKLTVIEINKLLFEYDLETLG